MNQATPSQEARPVAFFDFDGTLTTGDTLMPFLKYVVGTPKYYAKLALVSPVLIAYFSKLLRNDIAKRIVLKQYLAGYNIDALFELGQRFSEEVIPTMLRPEGMERLRWHQDQGHECVLVSASLDVYLNAWASGEWKFSELICTELEVDRNGNVHGGIRGLNCYGEEKLRRIESWRGQRILLETFAYGDTDGDLPMINSATHGFMWKGSEERFCCVNSL